jgi:ketosteroid isomerase-like protein
MSVQNIELVERMLACFHSGDADGAIACFSEDVIVDASRRPDGAAGRGHEALGRIVADWVGTFDEWNEVIEVIEDHGDEVHVVATQRGRGKGSGVEVEARYAIVYGVRDGEIVSFTLYPAPDTRPS